MDQGVNLFHKMANLWIMNVQTVSAVNKLINKFIETVFKKSEIEFLRIETFPV